MASSKTEDHSETNRKLCVCCVKKKLEKVFIAQPNQRGQMRPVLAKLSAGNLHVDLVAIGAKYHGTCLGSLYNKAKSASNENSQSGHRALKGMAFKLTLSPS